MHPIMLDLVTSFLAVFVCIVVGFYLLLQNYLSSGHHWTIVDVFKPGVYCNICSTSMFYGVECDYCGVVADFVCVKNADNDLVCKQVSIKGQLVHHWIHGNLPINSICCACEKDCGSGPGLVDYRCCWCQRTIHENCLRNFAALCDLGKVSHEFHRHCFVKFIMPPNCVEAHENNANLASHRTFKRRTRKEVYISFFMSCAFQIRTPKGVNGWKPLIVFANRSSGSGDGGRVLRSMRRLLNPLQVALSKYASHFIRMQFEVFDLWYDHPSVNLQMLHAFEEGIECYVLVAGGDGSFGWVLDAVEGVKHSNGAPARCKMALLPLGTGNDLCRVLGWNVSSTDFVQADSIFDLLSHAESTFLDRWLVSVSYPEKLGGHTFEHVRKMNNYLSIGVDAQVTLNFHRKRNSIPRLLSGRFINKMLFFVYGTKEVFEHRCRNLNSSVELRLDGRLIELPKLEAIVLLNIACWGAGVRPWQLGKGGPEQSMNDGIFEVFGVYSSFHIAQMQVGLSEPYRIGQAKEVTMKIKNGLFPIQPSELLRLSKMGAVNRVFLSSDVHLICLTHAFSSEKEEVMGLLIGFTDEAAGICSITNCIQLKRLVKKKDRVELMPEVLSEAITYADQLNAVASTASERARNERQRNPLRVIGWYHSHPHITVFPSAVDNRTQEEYQNAFDPMWIGLIFAVFNNEEDTGLGRVQYLAFQVIKFILCYFLLQAHGGHYDAVPVIIVPKTQPRFDPQLLDHFAVLINVLFDEELDGYTKAAEGLCQPGDLPLDALTLANNACIYSSRVCKIVYDLVHPLLSVLTNLCDNSVGQVLESQPTAVAAPVDEDVSNL
ncbi:JAB and DAGK acc and C1 1 and DAGK cat domain con taining protein [Trichuris trichiura]|uniref:Diacylglycerol kinase n=1 Tax=Trichuris trichiura TaxID=36087 RepID=A0A077Z1I6_TRITR|nr:JAB and DAGK acc and C1 1 and DAGK cat domain con taining protein [Trichuris trichiura]